MSALAMPQLTTAMLGRACRIFMELAYPEGPDTIPAKKRVYFNLPLEQSIAAFLPPAACAAGVCQEFLGDNRQPCGYALRLGSSGFAHLKLRLQLLKQNGHSAWVFMVDTHDGFSKDSRFPPPDHPDAKDWLLMQQANRMLKQNIETAFEENGLATLNSILRDELQRSP